MGHMSSCMQQRRRGAPPCGRLSVVGAAISQLALPVAGWAQRAFVAVLLFGGACGACAGVLSSPLPNNITRMLPHLALLPTHSRLMMMIMTIMSRWSATATATGHATCDLLPSMEPWCATKEEQEGLPLCAACCIYVRMISLHQHVWTVTAEPGRWLCRQQNCVLCAAAHREPGTQQFGVWTRRCRCCTTN